MWIIIISLALLLPSFIQTKIDDFNPTDCVLVFDLDDTLTHYGPFYKAKVVKYGLSLNPFKSWQYITALNSMRKTKKSMAGNQDSTYPKLVGGGFLQLTYAGIQEKNLRPHVPGLIDLIWSNAIFKEGIPELLTYLYEQGYELWIATNKDHVSYMQVLDSLDNRCAFKLLPLIKQSFVTWPTKETIEQLYTFKSNESEEVAFQKLVDLIPTINATPTIHHSHAPKPDPDYYKKMKSCAGKKQIIFFDDKKENTEAATKQGIQAYRVGSCQDIIAHLEALGILNIEKDPIFYKELEKGTFLKRVFSWV